jgi:ubiquinone/menaquinone biosynthesis C-methylase UbiE
MATALRLRCPRCHRPLGAPTDAAPVTCAGCGATYRSHDGVPVLLPERVDEDWRSVFDHMFRTAPTASGQMLYRFERQHQIMIDAYQRLLSPLPPGRLVLDVGCGHGKLAAPLAAAHQVVGVDFVPLGLPEARDRGLSVFQADGTALPFVDDQFDVVLCAEVFQNLVDIRPVLSELGRVCRPTGIVIVSTLNRASWLRRLATVVRWLQRRRPVGRVEEFIQTARQRTAGEIAADAERCGLAVRDVTWAQFPSGRTATTRSPRYWGAALATNVILTFAKRERSDGAP